MDLNDFWSSLRHVFLPSLGFIGVGTCIAYIFARFIGKLKVPGQIAFLFGFSTLGGVLGVTSGSAREPVLNALLPALLTFITILTGYMFNKDQNTKLRPILPYCITLFTLTVFYGFLLGKSMNHK